MLELTFRFALTILMLVGWGLCGYGVSRRLLPVRGISVRLLGSLTASLAAATMTLLLLGWMHALNVVTMFLTSATAGACGIYSGRHGAWRRWLRNDKRALETAFKELGWPVVSVIGVLLATLYLLDCASLGTPLLGWDSLHYHLVRIAYWAQDGGFQAHPGVDAWSYYEFYPMGGEILWAWVSIPLRNSALVGTAGVAIAALVALATLVCARTLGASRTTATLAGCAVVASPAVIRFATNGYVDNLVLAYVATALALAFRAKVLRRWRATRVLLVYASMASGLALLAKITAWPIVALTWALCAIAVASRRYPWRSRALPLLAVTLTPVLIFGPTCLLTWSRTGSPVYPFELSIAGKLLFRGNAQLATVLSGQLLASRDLPFIDLVSGLFFKASQPEFPHLNLGKGGLLIVVMGVWGLLNWLARRPREWEWIVLLALAATCAPLFLAPEVRGLRIVWWGVSARLMLQTLFALAVLGTSIRSKAAAVGFALATVVDLPSHLDLGFCKYRWLSAIVCGLSVALAGVLMGAAARLNVRRLRWPIVGGTTLLIGLEVALIRPELEPLVYAGAVRAQCFEADPLLPRAMATPVWNRLRDAPSRTIAVVAGFDGIGHSVLRYPLLGGRWQHRLVYVSPAADGKLRNFEELYGRGGAVASVSVEFSYERWLERLTKAGVTHVMLIGPANVIEWRWVIAHPSQFVMEEIGNTSDSALFALRLPGMGA